MFECKNLHFVTQQSKEVGIQMQDELLKVTSELQTVSVLYKYIYVQLSLIMQSGALIHPL